MERVLEFLLKDILKAISTGRKNAPKKESVKELAKAVVHSGSSQPQIIEQCKKIIPYSNEVIEGMDPEEALKLINNLSALIKAEKEKKRMKELRRVSEDRLSHEMLNEKALKLAERLCSEGQGVNSNKLKRLNARVSASRDPYEALAHLAKFYPLKGVPADIIDALVEKLGKLELRSFKDLFALGLIFYEAKKKGWEG